MILFLVGIVILLVGTAPLAWALTRSPQLVSAVHLVPASAGLFFGLPPIVYMAIAGTSMGEVLPGGSEHLWPGVLSITVFVAVCSVTSVLLARGRRDAVDVGSTFSRLASVRVAKVISIALLVWTARVYLATAYGQFYAGSGAEATVPYVLTVASRLCDLLAIGVMLWSVWALATASSRTRSILAIVLVLLEAVYVFTQGRREMFFVLVLCGVVFLYARRGITWKYIVAGLLGASVLALAAFPLYQATRQVVGERSSPREGLVSVSSYYRGIVIASQRADVGRLYLSNLEYRLSLYYRWQVELASLRDRAGGLDGQLALAGLTYAIPRFLLQDKNTIAWGEEVVTRAYGVAVRDAPNSVVAAGFADLGITGAALYGFLFVFLVRLAHSAGIRVARRSPLFGTAFMGGVMLLALRTEISMVGVFASLRDLVIFGMIAVGLAIVVRSYRRRVFT